MSKEPLNENKSAPLSKKKKWGKRILIGFIVLLTFGFLLRGILVWHAQSLVDKQLQVIREKGEPLSAAGLRNLQGTISAKENGAPYFQLAAKIRKHVNEDMDFQNSLAYKRLMRSIRDKYKADTLNGEFNQEDLLEAKNYFSAMEEPFELLEKALRKKDCDFELEYEKEFGLPLSHLAAARAFARDTKARAILFSREGNASETVGQLLSCAGISQIMEKEPVLVSYLVKIAVLNLQSSGVETCLEFVRFSPEQLKRIREAAIIRAKKSFLKEAMLGERVFGISMYQRTLKGKSIEAWEGPGAETGILEKPLYWFAKPYFLYDQNNYLEIFRSIIENLEDPKKKLSSLTILHNSGYLLSSLILPVYGSCEQASLNLKAKVEAMNAALKLLETLDGDVSRLPETKEQFHTAINKIGGLPFDPMDQNGKRMNVKITKEYIYIYGVGGDLVDDGGKWESDKDPGFILPRKLRGTGGKPLTNKENKSGSK